MNDPKQQREEITREMQERHAAIAAKIGAPELTIAGFAKGAFAALAGSSDPLGISSALVDDLRAQVAALQDTLDLNNDEFARIWAMSADASEVRQLCDRARRRTKQTVPLIVQLEQSEADVRMWKGNYEAAEQHVTILTKQLAENEAKWKAVFEKRVAREEELLNDTIQETVNDVLAKLNANGVDTTDCDGDEDVVTILAHWIESRISLADAENGERAVVECLAAVANQRNELIEAMKQLYKADTMLRLHVMQAAPKVKGFSSWTAHTDALRVAERALRTALMGGGGAEQVGDGNRGTKSAAQTANDA